jgi:hypothetical protein
VAADTSAPASNRLTATLALLGLSRWHAGHGKRLLTAIATDRTLRAWERRQAAEHLAALGPGDREVAVEILEAITEDGAADPWERSEAAEAATELRADTGRRNIDQLQATALDHGLSGRQRLHAAAALLHLGAPASLGRHALQDIMDDPSIAVRDRRLAAEHLATLGPDARRQAEKSLSELVELAEPIDRALARRTLRTIRHETPIVGDPLLIELAQQGTPSVRRRAAAALADCPDQRIAVVTALREVTCDVGATPFERALASRDLAAYDAIHRSVAVAALLSCLTPAADAGMRRRIAASVARLESRLEPSAGVLLSQLAIDTSATADDRLAAAVSLGSHAGDWSHRYRPDPAYLMPFPPALRSTD